jgi:hypothetical protein
MVGQSDSVGRKSQVKDIAKRASNGIIYLLLSMSIVGGQKE